MPEPHRWSRHGERVEIEALDRELFVLEHQGGERAVVPALVQPDAGVVGPQLGSEEEPPPLALGEHGQLDTVELLVEVASALELPYLDLVALEPDDVELAGGEVLGVADVDVDPVGRLRWPVGAEDEAEGHVFPAVDGAG